MPVNWKKFMYICGKFLTMAKIIGLGSALTDLLIKLEDDSLLQEFKLPKGSMTLVDNETKDLIARKTSHLEKEMVSGGSAANTIHGLAQLGAETAFLGKIGTDETGEFFKADLEKNHIKPLLIQSSTASGVASALVSKDGERTFGTFLGASVELTGDELTEEHFRDYDILHIEGYLIFNHQLLEAALQKAKKAGLRISLDLASYNVVEENLEFLKNMVKDYVDILFANEEEAYAYTGKENPEEALEILAEHTELTVVKIGKKGSLVKCEGTVYKIPAIATKAIDTTGAGDVYAAGFLFGMIHDMNLMDAGYLGSLMAAKVIETYGAKIPEVSLNFIRQEIKSLQSA